MPEALVRGVRIHYEIVGKSGPVIALTPGSRRGYGELTPFATKLAERGYRVLLHDRRNCGSSEVAFDGSASEHEVWADDLHELASQLGGLPFYVGGSSAGARLALLVALRHPDAVKGLLLWRVTGGRHAVEKLAESYYGAFIKIAKESGMEGVARSDHFGEVIAARPANRDRLLAVDPHEFIRVMGVWRERFLEAATLPVVGATQAQLAAISMPACIIAGNDQVHPPATAREVHRLISASEFHDDVVEKRADDNLKEEWDRQEWANVEDRMIDIFAQFLARAEKGAASAKTAP